MLPTSNSDDQHSRKRQRGSTAVAGHSNKKRILMEHALETPHPSIQTRDQIFKLPSSRPSYSPNSSPVPITTTRSRYLKENRTSTPWTEHTSKTLTSGGKSTSASSSGSSVSTKCKDPSAKKSLKANMKPRSSKPRIPKSGSGSGKNLARVLASPFVSRASSPIYDQGSNLHPNNPPPPNPRTTLSKRGLSDTFYNSNLPNPPRSQANTTEGPHEREEGKERKFYAQSAHTSPSSKAPPVLLDLNTQLKQKRRKGAHRGTVSVDGTRGNGSAIVKFPGKDLIGIQGAEGQNEDKGRGQQRERCPSAPSSYSLRPRPRVLLLPSHAPAGLEGTKTRRSRLTFGLEIIHHDNGASSADTSATTDIPTAPTATTNHTTYDDGFVVPLLPNPHNKTTTAAAEPDIEMDWRVGIVDFDRPPSQMCHYPTIATLGDWGGGDVFSSSGSEGSSSSGGEEDEDGRDGGIQETNPTRASRTRHSPGSGFGFDDPFGFGFGFASVLPSDLDLDQSRFGDGAQGVSTPLKPKRERRAHDKKGRKENRRTMVKASSTSDLRSKNGGLVKMRSLPVMGSIGGRGMELENEYEDEKKGSEEQDPYEREQDEQDMDLTTPLITATAAASITLGVGDTIQLVDGRGDMTPWIMDSLISPPSRYLETQDGIGKVDRNEECLEQDREGEGRNLSSKTSSSSSPSQYSLLSSPFRLTPEACIQLRPTAGSSTSTAVAVAVAVGATAITTVTAKRTRSGTIVPSSHRVGSIPNNNIDPSDPPGTRRTRSGTLVGPLHLPLPLTAVQPVGNVVPVRRTRERSGTILAVPSLPLPLPVGASIDVSAPRRTRSGTIIGPIPVSTPALPVSVLVSSEKSTKGTGPGPDILEERLSNSKSSESGNIGPDRAGEVGDGTLDEFNVDPYVDAEPHVDALYIPRLSSSPDPIDFLRLARFRDHDRMRENHRLGFEGGFGLAIKEQEDENPDRVTDEGMGGEMEWCIADEPPSPTLLRSESKPVTGRSQGGILSAGGGRYGRMRGGIRANGDDRRGNGRGNTKGKGKMRPRTRFIIDGHEEQPDEVVIEREEGEDSDDELLLADRPTLNIWE